MTDIILSEFVSVTGLEPAVAQDILHSHSWDPQEALKAYTTLKTARLRETKKDISPTFLPPKRYPELPPGRVDSAGNIIIPVGRPILQKNDAVDISEDTAGRKWTRGISRASENLALVTRARSEVAKGFTLDDPACVPNHTFTLPDLTVIQPEDFRAFVENDLIETATLVSLEQAGRLNWWADTKPCQRLLPLATTGDGNCLLHAASLGIWGFHDRLLTLRKSLNHVLSKSEYEAAIYRRWRWHQTILNKQSGLIYTESEWDKEWFNILKLSSTEPRGKPHTYICCDNSPIRNGLAVVEERESETTSSASCHNTSNDDNTQYESLEEIHVFALAYAIKRPIIVIADVYLRDSAGEPLAPIPFGGIYLPLGCDPKNCLRSPLVLTYDAAHFSSLVPMKRESPGPEADLPAIIPVTDSQGQLLPILFLVDPGESFQWGHEDSDPQIIHRLTNISQEEKLHVLLTYLDLVKVTVLGKGKESVSSGVDDRRSTADSNESESSSGGRSDVGKPGKTGIGKHMKNVKQKLKRSISKLTRRTSEENDVGVVKGAQEKNAVLIEQKVNNVEETEKIRPGETVGENGHFRWKLEMIKDVPEGGLFSTPNSVLGSLLSCDQETSFHEEMISNYLNAARSRFATHQKDRERRDNLQMPNGTLRCANVGCDLVGSVATNYLCPTCYSRQKTQLEEMKAQRETTTIGKSTFYANTPKEDQVLNGPVLNNQKPLRGNSTPQLPRPNPMETTSARFRPLEEDLVVKPCATASCPFFGHEKSEWLCSQCYRGKNAGSR